MRRLRLTRKEQDRLSRWTIKDSVELYGVDRWSDGISSINAAGVTATPLPTHARIAGSRFL